MKRFLVWILVWGGLNLSEAQEIFSKPQQSVKEKESAPARIIREIYHSFWSKGDIESFRRYLTDDFVDHMPLSGQKGDKEEFIQKWLSYLPAMPIRELAIQFILQEGDKVAVYYTLTGDLMANWGPILPIGGRTTLHLLDIFTFRGNMIVEHWGFLGESGANFSAGLTPPNIPQPPTPSEPPAPPTPPPAAPKKAVKEQKSTHKR